MTTCSPFGVGHLAAVLNGLLSVVEFLFCLSNQFAADCLKEANERGKKSSVILSAVSHIGNWGYDGLLAVVPQ